MEMSPATLATIDHAMERASRQVCQQLSARVSSLALIASVAPLLGTLLNVRLFVGSFLGCGGERSACMAATVERIAQSFVPAAFGLATAIPAYVAYHSFTDRLRDCEAECKAVSCQVLNLLLRL
ncbi:MAG: MotA/TolQ/ExbB proton channel family protein [Bryobacterales bacterium]|nr:MotA/TolQ/ExbB proton channel family protein [Bryobacterales bacterium]